VVIGVVQDAVSRRTENGIVVTDYHLVVEDALKGTVPDVLTITEIGGTIGTQFSFIAGSATYASGERVLAFLKRRSDGTFFTTAMVLGKFTFDGATTATTVTLSFPANSALQLVQKLLAAGEVWAIDNVLPTLWNTTGGGAVVATTDSTASLVVTAWTYTRGSDGGTFGQFIPGVTAADAVGVGDRPLRVVQLEQSPAFRSNLGLVEVTGNPVTVDVAGYTPESKIAAHAQVTLAPGQFTQLGSVFAGLGFASNVYNGRIAVTVISGTGRAAAYGSIIDNRTQDPTYVPHSEAAPLTRRFAAPSQGRGAELATALSLGRGWPEGPGERPIPAWP